MGANSWRVGKIQVAANVMAYNADAEITINFATGEDTGIGQDWATHQPLGRSWSMSGTAKFDYSNAAQGLVLSEFLSGDGKLTSVFMYYSASAYFKGSCFVTSASVRKSVGALDVFTFSFLGNHSVQRSG